MKYIKYTKELLEPVVKESVSISDVCRRLGRYPGGSVWDHVKKKIEKFDIDTSHFLGQAAHAGALHTGKAKKQLPEEVLVEGKTRREKAHRLRRALLESGVEYKCVACDIRDRWNDRPITLEVHHINEDWSDCRKQNLSFMCPNCHSQVGKK